LFIELLDSVVACVQDIEISGGVLDNFHRTVERQVLLGVEPAKGPNKLELHRRLIAPLSRLLIMDDSDASHGLDLLQVREDSDEE